jgi:uncharacterized protein (TIGR03067 family)
MRRSAVLLLLCAVGLATAGPREDAVKKELSRFQGTWQAVSAIGLDGKPLAADALKATTIVIEGNKYTLRVKDDRITGTFSIDPARKPKTMDGTFTLRDGTSGKFLGLYEIDGDRRRSCIGVAEGQRPTRWQQDGCISFEWQRPKP